MEQQYRGGFWIFLIALVVMVAVVVFRVDLVLEAAAQLRHFSGAITQPR
ncbi:hypothetical protein WPS_19470 [Vulcanimicrobium alpinum]|uniref:Uncharacterized protein n=1 Tax=Vulcanimicrobium alpinum TaxID=3016050 RepID=A0AAN2CA33_UNVUL|nr:hypothetical protein [Vulcanimicrobium alpinum]BDE06671.1 hypothetical protein WPS_19470 [Vulcanimicrobium alpinum]